MAQFVIIVVRVGVDISMQESKNIKNVSILKWVLSCVVEEMLLMLRALFIAMRDCNNSEALQSNNR